MENIYANRMKNVPRSFIREILKVVDDPEIISFAGGLPNPDLFPVDEIKNAIFSMSNPGNPEKINEPIKSRTGITSIMLGSLYHDKFTCLRILVDHAQFNHTRSRP